MADRTTAPASCVNHLLKNGVEKAESRLLVSRKTEINYEGSDFSLMRTTDDISLRITGINENRRASTVINKTDDYSLAQAVTELMDLIESGEADPAVDISGYQEEEFFSRGPEEPDVELMYSRLDEFVGRVRLEYPSLLLEQVILDHTLKYRSYENSNGVKLSSKIGEYTLVAMFTAKEGENTSSFNYSAVCTENLNVNLWEMGSIDELMQQSVGQTVTTPIPETFSGDVIVTPDCLYGFISTLAHYLTDHPMMTGTSIYKDSLNKKIADTRLTLRSMPLSEQLSGGYFITEDGFKAGNTTILEEGILRSFLLTLYGSRKTGHERAVSSGSFYVVDPGDETLEDMVKSVKKGLLLCRFSGGNPASNGDFSGVAKNSYYIEDGKISFPVSETMVAGNIKEMLNSIVSISRETVNNGYSILPWIMFNGITVSGK